MPNDQEVAAKTQARGLLVTRVTNDQILALLQRTEFITAQPIAGNTSTFVHAFLGRFYLATGHSACVDPRNFDAVLGERLATDKAYAAAREELWKLEGYVLYRYQNLSPGT